MIGHWFNHHVVCHRLIQTHDYDIQSIRGKTPKLRTIIMVVLEPNALKRDT